MYISKIKQSYAMYSFKFSVVPYENYYWPYNMYSRQCLTATTTYLCMYNVDGWAKG